MKYNFDKQVDRRGTNCVKWDEFDDPEIIPMWVADMDFETAPCITKALKERMEHGCYGYTFVPDSFYKATIDWFSRRHGWKISGKQAFVYTSGVVPALSAIIKAMAKAGEKVLIQTPVYNCFFSSIRNNGCEVVENPLRQCESVSVDWEDFERKCADPKVKVFVLCNPHNPVGRCWTRGELLRVNEICLRNHVLVISDEIHCDLVLPGCKHTPYATLSKEAADHCIVFHAPSKTFNLAGLATSTAIIPNKELRDAYVLYVEALEAHLGNIFGKVATQASMEQGDEWLRQLLEYVQGNIDYVSYFLEKNLPKVKFFKPQATYMMWLDFNGYGLSEEELWRKMTQGSGLGFNRGLDFGQEGSGFFRINLACPRVTVEEAMRRLFVEFRS